MIARAVGGLLVQLLLHLVHRYLQVEAGQVLPALTVRTVPGLVRRQRQTVGQQHRIGRLIEPAAQGRVVIEAVLLAQRMLAVAGNAQDFHQFPLLGEQQSIALLHPDRQAPDVHQGLADVQQAYAKQLLFDFARRLAFMNDPQLPVFEQLRMSQGQRPQRRQKQQAAPVDVLPQARQATGKKTVGLLAWRAG